MTGSTIRRIQAGLIIGGLAMIASAWGAVYVTDAGVDGRGFRREPFTEVLFLAEGFAVENRLTLEEEVSALANAPDASSDFRGATYVATSPKGGVFAFGSQSLANTHATIGLGLGERIQNGSCTVNAIAARDFDGDGVPEVLASTSQIDPRGRPRLYLWSAGYSSNPRSMARPDIRSSWSHGLGVVNHPDGKTTSLYVTFCGYGEIVEYRIQNASGADGFNGETLGWRKVGQLPASGEWLQAADADNDGATDVCVGTGFAENKAAIHVYRPEPSGDLALKLKIEEESKFGNVHFLVDDLDGSGKNEILAWWCRDIDGGDSELIRYKVDAKGVVVRTPIAKDHSGSLLPRDGQIAMHDMDGDGRREVWYATQGGRIWSYDAVAKRAPRQMLQVDGAIGPIVSHVDPYHSTKSGLYFGYKNRVARLYPKLKSGQAESPF